MKRIILLLSILIIFSFNSVYAYNDLVGENKCYSTASNILTELGIVNGYSDGDFKPNNYLTRAEYAKMLVRCLGLDEYIDEFDLDDVIFSDVESTHWAAKYIQIIKNYNIMNVYDDNTFKPEQNITYAEMFYGALRTLGYGALIETEGGEYPTAYMLKAVELELTNDVPGTIRADNDATRGNTAIVLWNMLRTPMWKIYEESEGNGMTLSEAENCIFINVKFPNYRYTNINHIEEIICQNADIIITVGDYQANARKADVTDLISGMKVEALIKDYKDEDIAEYLYIDNINTVVTGIVEDINEVENSFVVNGRTYKFADASAEDKEIYLNEYIIFEVYGSKVTTYDYEYVLQELSLDGQFVGSQSAINRLINEDDVIFIDGKYAFRDEIEIGDVCKKFNVDYGYYWVVSTDNTIEGIFSIMSEVEGGLNNIYTITIDDAAYYVPITIKAYKSINNELAMIEKEKLFELIEDNEFSGQKVTAFCDCFGSPIVLIFGDYTNKLKGDLDGDRSITISDVRVLLQAYINKDNSQTLSYEENYIKDMDGNGKLDISDIRVLLQLYINGGYDDIDDEDDSVEDPDQQA